jgi:hypothetical protein
MPAVGTGPRPSARPPRWAPAIACVPCGRCATHVSQAKGGSRSDKEPVLKRLFFRSHGALSRRGPIRNKLQQRPVGIAKINAHTLTFGPEARDRSELHWHIAASQMRDRRVDRPMPFEAQITVTGLNWQPGHRHGTKTRAVHIELRPTKPVRPPRELFDEISAHDLLVECVAACPVGHVNHAVVERYAKHLTLPLRLRSRNVKRLIRPFRHRVRALAKAAHPVTTRTPSPFRPVSRVNPATNQGVTAGNLARFLPRFPSRVWDLIQRWDLGAATIGPRASSLEDPGLRDQPSSWGTFWREVSSEVVVPAHTGEPLARPRCAGAKLRVVQDGWREARMKNSDSVCRFTVRQRDRWKTHS